MNFLHAFKRCLAGDRVAQAAQLAVCQILLPDRRLVTRMAGPLLECVAASQADVQPALYVALLILGEAGEFTQLGDRQRCGSGLGHGLPSGDRPILADVS
jgi:hypothetical protein